ncbi:MAG: Nif3-like dinuclear metal center hexameric protein, partial [Eubacteriales bacterium]|nr:Nif3-like dinuclear metal center hexameric protein [Eubacteriales bacterium]
MHEGLSELVRVMEALAPPELAEPWDNVGLVLEGTRPVRKVLLALDVTVAAAAKVAREGFDVLITHHPPFIAPVKKLTYDDPNTAALLILAQAGVSLYCAHTNLDFAPCGTARALCEALELPFAAWPEQPGCMTVFAGSPQALGDRAAQHLGGQPRVWAAGPCKKICLV